MRPNDYSKVHRNNLINNILTQIEASAAGADDATMRERDGFLPRTSANLAYSRLRRILGACRNVNQRCGLLILPPWSTL